MFFNVFSYSKQRVLFPTRCALRCYFWTSWGSLGRLLASSWPLLGTSWAQLGPSWPSFRGSWAPLGLHLGGLGRLLASIWGLLGVSWGQLGPLGLNFGSPNHFWSLSWRLLGIWTRIGCLKYFFHMVLTTMWCYPSLFCSASCLALVA